MKLCEIPTRHALAIGVVVLGLAATPAAAFASDNGVGPESDTTGHARACEAHAANNGVSAAGGVPCGSITLTVGSAMGGFCQVTVSTTPLYPGFEVSAYVSPGGPENNVSFGTATGGALYATYYIPVGSNSFIGYPSIDNVPLLSNTVYCQ